MTFGWVIRCYGNVTCNQPLPYAGILHSGRNIDHSERFTVVQPGIVAESIRFVVALAVQLLYRLQHCRGATYIQNNDVRSPDSQNDSHVENQLHRTSSRTSRRDLRNATFRSFQPQSASLHCADANEECDQRLNSNTKDRSVMGVEDWLIPKSRCRRRLDWHAIKRKSPTSLRSAPASMTTLAEQG